MRFDYLDIQRHPIDMDDLKFDLFFDEKGKEIYDEVSKKYFFSFSYYNQNALAVSVNGNFADFLIPQNKNINKALFTHELLHFYLRVNDIDNEKALRDSIDRNNLSEVFCMSEDAFMYIHNFLDHIIFYNDFKNMGYKDNDFCVDYKENKFDKDIEAYFWYKFEKNIPGDDDMSFYISKYIGLRAPTSIIRNYSKAYVMLKRMHPRLYNICKNFVDRYELIANEEYDDIYAKYKNIINDFILDLKQIYTPL